MSLASRTWFAGMSVESGLGRIGLWVLIAVYLLLGLMNHELWRSDDAITLAVARGFDANHWLIPRLAGEPWLGSPPLYHWLASILGHALSPLLAWHSGARLASALILGGALIALSSAVRHLHGRDAAQLTPLLVIGTLGLLVPAHEAQPALMAFLAFAMSLAAFALWHAHPFAAPAALGTGLGIGFLGTGLSALLPLLGLVATAWIHPHWRIGQGRAWAIAIVVAIVLSVAWPFALFNNSPHLFDRWWSSELHSLGANTDLTRKRIQMLSWAAWPVLPLGLWMLWLERRRLSSPANFLGFGGLAISLLLFLRGADATQGLMPLLAILVLIGTPAAGRLRRGAANAFDWFGGMTLTLFMGLVWLGGIAILTGSPARVAKNFSKPAPGFVAEWSWWALTAAVIASIAWLWVLLASPRSPWRAARRWAVGLCTLWVLLATLWLPWVDYGKSYRSVVMDIQKTLGPNPGCIERRRLDAAHRAVLDYYGGIRTVPVPGSAAGNSSEMPQCRYRITQAHPTAETELDGWTLLLQRSRPGEKSESLRLYRRGE